MVCPAVLIVAFNRPETTRRVFAAVRKAKPPALFFACDGARSNRPDEEKRVAEVRALVSTVDWPCKVYTRFSEKNLGCAIGVSSAIEWFLNDAGEGIILEDDCLPTPAFFRFCAVMLERYRHDERVGVIAGSNMAPLVTLPYSYGFSRIFSCWGWATWLRTWKNYQLQHPPVDLNESAVSDLHPRAAKFLSHNSLKISQGEIYTWDYQCLIQLLWARQLTVIPRDNLVLNIGFDGDGAHYNRKSGRPWSAPAFAFNPDTRWEESLPVVFNQQYDKHFLASAHRGSSKLYRQILKWRLLWHRRFSSPPAFLFD